MRPQPTEEEEGKICEFAVLLLGFAVHPRRARPTPRQGGNDLQNFRSWRAEESVQTYRSPQFPPRALSMNTDQRQPADRQCAMHTGSNSSITHGQKQCRSGVVLEKKGCARRFDCGLKLGRLTRFDRHGGDGPKSPLFFFFFHSVLFLQTV